MTQDLLTIKYIPLSKAVVWDKNPKLHDKPGIKESIQRHGFKDPPKFEPSLNNGNGGLVEGNGRTTCLVELQESGEDPPRGILALEDPPGEWAIPVLFGVDAESEAAAQAYAIDHNSLVMLGGDFDLVDTFAVWDENLFMSVLGNLDDLNELPVSLGDLDISALEPFGETSVDRANQGVGSTWDQVKSAASGKVIIDDIETRLSDCTVKLLKGLLIAEYEQNDRPIHETLEAVIVAGIEAQ